MGTGSLPKNTNPSFFKRDKRKNLKLLKVVNNSTQPNLINFKNNTAYTIELEPT